MDGELGNCWPSSLASCSLLVQPRTAPGSRHASIDNDPDRGGYPGGGLPRPTGPDETMRDDLKPGNTFPDFTLPNQEGKALSLSEAMKGWPVLLTFKQRLAVCRPAGRSGNSPGHAHHFLKA